MNLEQEKQFLKDRIEEFETKAMKYRERYLKIRNCRQPDTSELYNGIESYFTFEERFGTYEHVLGGDGRSRPWSENREGGILTVKINEGIYLDQEQLAIIKGYVDKKYNPEHIEFKNV